MGIIKRYESGGKLGNSYSTMLDSVIALKGGKKEDYERLMGGIAFHESKYIVSNGDKKSYKYFDHKAKQVGGGPGRGLFMFEEGEKMGGITAVNRTVNHFKKEGMEIPGWLSKAHKSKSLDASELTPEQQKTLFLGNYLEHEKANIGNVINGSQTVEDFWGRYHQTQNDPDKLKNFGKDFSNYESNYNKPEVVKEEPKEPIAEDTTWNKDTMDRADPLRQLRKGGLLYK